MPSEERQAAQEVARQVWIECQRLVGQERDRLGRLEIPQIYYAGQILRKNRKTDRSITIHDEEYLKHTDDYKGCDLQIKTDAELERDEKASLQYRKTMRYDFRPGKPVLATIGEVAFDLSGANSPENNRIEKHEAGVEELTSLLEVIKQSEDIRPKKWDKDLVDPKDLPKLD